MDDKSALFHDMLNYSNDMIFIIRIDDGHVDYMNETTLRILGYTFDELQELGIDKIRRPLKSSEPFYRHLQELKQVGKLTDYAILTKKDGTKIPIEANVRYLHRDGVDYNIAIVRDITDRIESEKRLENLNRQLKSSVIKKEQELHKTIAFLNGYKLALDAGNIVSKSDLSGNITYVNDKFCEVSGFNREELIGRAHSIVRHSDTASSIFEVLWRTVKSKKMWHGIIKNRKKDGGYYWVDMVIVPIMNEADEIVEYIAVRHEITKLIAQQEKLEHILATDALTEYGNRHLLMKDITETENPSLALINIDNFREINDFYGHDFGDLLIIEVANTINSIIRDRNSKKFYRLDGDEFAVLANGLNHETFIEKAKEIIAALAETHLIIRDEEIAVQVTVSISFEHDKLNLFTSADMAMRSAKKNQQSLLIYDTSLLLNTECENNIKWTKKLQKAIRNDRIVPYYQPIVDNITGEYNKYESLVRLIDEEGKVISPFFFLEIAKRTKYYRSITQTVLEKSFLQFKDTDLTFSVNLTIKDIMDEETQQSIFTLLESYGIGERVVFEIVESEGIENYDRVIAFIKNVKECGCKIAIDDFGTGYSNFEYLLKLKADFIKIDGSLIKALHNDKDAKILVATIVNFSKQLGMLTIAEFVSDKKTYDLVKEMGIDYSQGYYFGEPKEAPVGLSG
ncbi:GGDEF domain-containing phosphodiesterase [Sulfuricurvum sp.]|uniref:sensor domain-containing protein n=1 Tax=Sulfuricurvum sp. TaxID=2025608 RepID=UPI002635BAF6|nr:GGDEF domain-containing phosphodiesterase [Sulfuricurvum sp.]MDD2782569.1 EAL domain-containing protein [Sulfuricurvum sp.]